MLKPVLRKTLDMRTLVILKSCLVLANVGCDGRSGKKELMDMSVALLHAHRSVALLHAHNSVDLLYAHRSMALLRAHRSVAFLHALLSVVDR